ncbi:MAG: hypothetical protein A2031_05855 [Deltaproteobacteria bacterium RBG_19FT_COMBO_43_11]|nr:MAG: hypothetical protein A2W27_07135 [Deltaproteobacteria bacterium RBG_16_44_11]OGP91108.1 MAG: hypothetical protein A2031_05855 [Deltaproteobacteria bacterium RBG_19FT_COMBO_43_11]
MVKKVISKISNHQSLRILMVEDSEDDVLLIIRELKKGGYDPVYERVETATAMKKALKEKQWDIILCDYKLPKFNAPSALAVLEETNIEIPVIIVSGTIGEETAVECMRLGAQDYIMKNNLSRLCPAVARELEEADSRSKHKQAAKALRESEEKYRNILEDMDEGYFEIDLKGNFTFVNNAECRNMGYSREELIGMNNRQYTDEENAKKAFQAFNNLYKTGEPSRIFDYEVIKKDGTKAVSELLVSLIKDSKGKLIGFRGLSRHITERKQADEKLRQSEEKYRTILENIEDGYYEVDLNGNFTFFNDSMCRILGYPQEEIVGMNNRVYTNKVNAKKIFQAFNEVYRTGKPGRVVDYEIIRKDGTNRYIETSISLHKDSSGKLIGFRGIIRDITERKQAEGELRESEEKYRLTFASTSDVIFMVDSELKVSNITPSVEKILGYKPEELINKFFPDLNLMTPESLKRAIPNVGQILSGAEVPNVVYNFITKEGLTIIGEVTGSPIVQKGKIIGISCVARDITERKQAESQREAALEALRQNEEKYRNILENIEDGYYEVDLNGNFTFFNDSMCRILGYPQEEMMGMNNRQFTNKENAKKLFKTFNEVYRTGEPAKEFDWQIIRKDGTERHIEVSVSLQKNSSGKPIGFRGISRDVTSRKQAEKSLRQSEEKYRSILENMEDGYYETDLTGNFTFFNDSLCKIYGYPRKELMGMNDEQYTDEENAKKVFKFFNKIYRTGESGKIFDNEIIRKDGAKRQIEVSGSLKKDSLGNPTGFSGIIRDITERKRAEEVLRQSEEKYRTIIETIQEGYFEIDLAGNFTFVNDAQCKITGTPREQLIGKNNRGYTSEEEAKRLYQIYNRIYRTGEPEKGYAFEFIRRDGTKASHEVSVSLIMDAKGKPIGFRGISRDITERKQMEEALRQSEDRYRTIIETMEDGYWETDLPGNFTFVNDAECKIAGTPKEQLIGRNNQQYTDKTTAKRLYETFKEIYKTGKPVKSCDFEFIRRNGTRVFAEFSVSLIRDAQGKPTGFRGVTRDVTERKQAEDTLAKSEEKYRRLVENAQEGIFQSTAEGQHIAVNQAFANILGYESPEEVITTITDISHQIYVHPDERTKILQIIEKEDSIKGYETEFYRKDGSKIWVSINMHAVRDDQGHLLYYQGIDQDITDKKKMELERQENIERLRKSLGATINAMAVTVETRDPYTAGHQRRVADLARSIAMELNLGRELIDGVRMASMIHDIGKISIPSEILTKPTKLTDLEFNLIKTHPESGYNILKDIEFPWPIARIVLEHHERINGSGYPSGLKGEQILLGSRILAIADVVEAISSHRPYRASKGIEAALDEISINKGILYEPDIVDACLRLFREKNYKMAA